MPTNRFGYSDDFVLNNGNVGINSSSPQEKLDVVGVVKGQDLKVVGVSSFSGYEGFLNSNQNVVENINLEAGQGITGSLSGEIIVGTGVTVTGIGSATSGQGQVDSLKVYNTFTVPSGGTLDRPSKAKPGQLYYNRDFATIEFYNGMVWRQVDNTTQRGRGLFAGGVDGPNEFATIDYINIASTGNSINFGSLSAHTSTFRNRRGAHGCASSTRGVFGSGLSQSPSPANLNVIDYVTIASEGDAIDFGDLTIAANNRASCSSSTRGLWSGGPAGNNTIDYIQISTIGNALDFGDLFTGRYVHCACSSPTRALFGGGYNVPGIPTISSIEVVTISSKGNAIVFGNLTQKRSGPAAVSNSVRGVFAGGFNTPAPQVFTMDYVTMASNGNAVEFGNLTVARGNFSGVSNATRGVFAGGYIGPGGVGSQFNTLDYITIASTGNAQDFGDLTQAKRNIGNCSDSHGGLGGF